MPAATLAGTIEGAAQRLKQLLASLSQDVRVMILSRNDAKDFQDGAMDRGIVSLPVAAHIKLC